MSKILFLVSCPALGAQTTAIESTDAESAMQEYRQRIKGLHGEAPLKVVDPDGNETESSTITTTLQTGGGSDELVEKANAEAEAAKKEADDLKAKIAEMEAKIAEANAQKEPGKSDGSDNKDKLI